MLKGRCFFDLQTDIHAQRDEQQAHQERDAPAKTHELFGSH
jgi:hypothetical protein